MSAAKKAKELAKHGRYGDTELLHVNKTELAGLASLAPGGRLPINPVTKLPEAFFFLPFLLGAGAAAAPAAAAAIPAAATMGAAAAPALASAALPAITATGALDAGAAGLGAGMASAGGAGLGALTSGINAATQAAASTLPAAGSMAPQVTQAAHGLTAAKGAAAPLMHPGQSLVGTLPKAPPIPTPRPDMLTTGATGGKIPPATMSNIAASDFGKGALGMNTGAFPAAPKAGGIGGLLGGMDMNSLMLPAMLLGNMNFGGGGKKSSDEGSGNVPDHYTGPDAVFPGSDYQGGIDPEWNYFPQGYAAGGLVDKPQAPMQATIYPNQPAAGGGIQSLTAPPQMQLPKAQTGSPYSGNPKDEKLILMASEAIKGNIPNADAVLKEFVKAFGMQALQDLIARVKGGGDGQSDSIPATVDGQQPARLSSGEHVIPSDVVAHLGNGDNQAGSQRLQDMQNRIRMMRGAQPQQPPAINPQAVLPA